MVARAIAFVAREQRGGWTIELGRSYFSRRWHIAEFDGALERYNRLPWTNQLIVWRRMLDRSSRVRESNIRDLIADDYMAGRALHCDRIPLPADYGETLARARAMGGYFHTHAAMALGLIGELGCAAPVPAAERMRIIEGLANVREGESEVSDLAIEAEAFLHWLGRRDLTDPTYVDRLEAAQNADGSWGDVNDEMRWHATSLGLFILLFSSESTPLSEPWIAPAREDRAGAGPVDASP